MTNTVVCSAPGKVIITGEHSVVYGEPALLTALSLRATAEVQKLKKPVVRFSSDAIDGIYEGSVKNLIDAWNRTKSAWRAFYEGGKQDELVFLRNEPFLVMMCAAGLVLSEAHDVDVGFQVQMKSELPLISGFGSSAYTASAVIGGVGLLLGKHYSKRALFERVYEVEKIMHGNPSGGDPAIVIRGGFLKFQKKQGKFHFKSLKIKPNLLKNMFLINSGKAVESTADLVVGVVGERLIQNPTRYRKIIKRIGKVSNKFINSLLRGELQHELLGENEKLLEELGVVGERAKKMIRKIEGIGGVAKISGGGGVKEGSGLMVAYHSDNLKLKKLIKKEKWQSFAASLGGEGWKIK